MSSEAVQQKKNGTARYLVAKYIPDLRRMEPRNIGVVVLSPDGVAARFLAEKDESGDVDGRGVPSYVRSASAYRQWVAYWRRIVLSGEIEGRSGGVIAHRDDTFADALLSSGKGAYCLVEGGFLLDRISPGELPYLARTLYRDLVDADQPEERPTLDSQIKRVLEETHLDKSNHLVYDYTVPLAAQGADSLPLTFSFAFKNGSLQRLYERVSLHASQREKSVYSAAFKFQHVVGSKVIEKQQTAALVYNPETNSEEKVERYLDTLRSVTRVINLADLESARREFAALPALAKH